MGNGGQVIVYKLLQDPDFLENPALHLADLRDRGPVIRSKVPIIGTVWFTTTQKTAVEVLKNDRLFSMRKGDGLAVGLSWWMPGFVKRLTSNMLTSDDPDHRRLRGIVDQAFQRRSIADMQDRIETLAQKQRDAMFKRGAEADLVSQFARPFPLAVISELLGLPETDRDQFTEWASRITGVTGMVSFLSALWKIRPFNHYIEDRIRYEKVNGGSGLIHELVSMDGEQLSHDELVSMVFLLLMAGHETTTHLIAGSIHALFQNPEQLQKLQENPEMLDLAVEELLRFTSPVMTTKPRYVQEDCLIEGQSISKGDYVMPLLIAANYDPTLFENPDKLDLSRRPNRHIEFGSGIHFCLGHQLARYELKAALKVLLMGEKPVRPGKQRYKAEWDRRFGLRSLSSLRVVV